MSQGLKPIKGSTWLWFFGVVMTVAGICLTLVYGRAAIYYRQGIVYCTKDLYDQAISYFNRAIELNPKLTKAYYYRGFSYYSKKEGGEVVDIKNQYEQAISDFTVAIRLQPELGGAYFLRGCSYLRIYQEDLALADFTHLIEIESSGYIVAAYIARAEIYRTKGILEWASSFDNEETPYDHEVALYDKAISDLTRALDNFHLRGWLAKQLDKAISDLIRALELSPNKEYTAADLYRRLGEVYSKKDYDEVIMYFNRAIEADPEVYSKKDYDKAIMNFNRAIEADPEDARAYDCRGCLYKNKNLYDDRAISDFNRALEINPGLTEAYNHREETYKERVECEQAILDNTHAIEINPEDANAYHKRGRAYMNKKLFDQAISDFNRAIEINPRDADAYYSKGGACECAGYKTEAVEAYKAFIKFTENNVRKKNDSYYLKRAKHRIIELMK